MKKVLLSSLTVLGIVIPGIVFAGSSHVPVTICHNAGPTKTITITVDDNALSAHLKHGDTIGSCNITVIVPPSVEPSHSPIPSTSATPFATLSPIPTPIPNVTIPPTDTE